MANHLTQVRNALVLPDGTQHGLHEKDVIPLRPEEVRMLSWLHQFAHDHQINIYCKRCEQPITGANNDNPESRSVSVACQCRQWLYRL